MLALLEGLVIVRARRRLTAEIAEPLHDLEVVVHQMARARTSGRRADGPREVRAVAGRSTTSPTPRPVRGRWRTDPEELRALDVAQDDFVSNVSHELRTPLTTISGYLELVADEFEGSMAPHHVRMLTAGRRNVARLQLLIDDLLTLSKAEAGPRPWSSSTWRRGPSRSSPTSSSAPRGADRASTSSSRRRSCWCSATGPMLHRALLNVLATR